MQDTHCRQHKYLRNQAQNIKVLDTSVKRGYLYTQMSQVSKKNVTSHITQVINNNSHIQTNMDDLSIHPQWIHIFNFVVTETIYH